MNYDSLDASTMDAQPYFLYLFAQGPDLFRFTNRSNSWISPPDAIGSNPHEQVWTACALSHGAIVQSSDPRRTDLDITFPLSDTFARRFLGPRNRSVTTLTIFRGHEQVPLEVVAHWKGRVVSARTSGARITLRCESLFTSMRRQGVRAKYQRLCRHALYAGGCRLNIEDFYVPAIATEHSGATLTVEAAAAYSDGWFRGGVLRHDGLPAFITGHSGALLTLAHRLPDLEAAINDPDITASIDIAPGCDLRRDTCKAKFDNLPNFGGFPDIPGRNPFAGLSII